MKKIYIKPEIEELEFTIEDELTITDLNPSFGTGDEIEDGIE